MPKLFRIASRAYLAGIALWALLFWVLGDRTWWMFVATSVGPFLFVPVPLLLVLTWRRDRWSWWGSLGIALLALVLYGRLFLPRPGREAEPPADGPRLTVLTFNLHYRNSRLDRVAELLTASGADVAVLQELKPATARYLRQALAEVYPYTVLDEESREIRPGIFSKLPLSDAARPPELGWTACTAVLHLDGRPVRVVGVHYPVSFLGRPRDRDGIRLIEDTVARREKQAIALIRFLRQHPEPTVVAGDFNTTPLSGLHRILTQGGLRDAWQEAGTGFGHTWGLKGFRRLLGQPHWIIRIDYVWLTPQWDAAAAEVRPWDGGSDHRAVRVELGLR